MFDIPFYTSNGEFQDHKNLKEKLLKQFGFDKNIITIKVLKVDSNINFSSDY